MNDFKNSSALNCEQLKKILAYDADTGVFTWVGKHSWKESGTVAGWLTDSGYRIITIDGVRYRAHHLAWLFVHGVLPQFIDHKNLVKSDNRIANLRECDKSRNNANSKVRRDSQSGIKGAYFHKQTNRWHAYITVNKKRIHLGCFATSALANDAYLAAAKRYFGDFARAA